jgi:hypothetical protein
LKPGKACRSRAYSSRRTENRRAKEGPKENAREQHPTSMKRSIDQKEHIPNPTTSIGEKPPHAL